jgi:AraC-like DNA-binding protein
MTTRVSTRVTTAVLRGLQRLGVDPDELCRDIGADPEVLRAADSRVSVVVLARLWLSAERMLRDPMIGLHTAEAIGPSGLFHYLTMTQSTVGRGIASLISSTRLASDNLVMTLDRAPATTVIGIHFSFRSGPGVAQSAEYVCGLLASHLYLTTGGRLVPDRVDFTHRARGPEAEYRRIMRSQVRFERADTRLEIPTAALDWPLRTDNPEVARFLSDQAQRDLAALDQGDLAARVGAYLRRMFTEAGDDSLECAAASLGMSPRTLQRRLRDEGTSFRKVHDNARREIASDFLADPSLSISEVADRLGFADVSAFDTAFKRWTKRTPRAYRRKILAVDSPTSDRASAGKHRH